MSEEMLALAVAKKCYNFTKRRKVSPDYTARLFPVDYLYDVMLLCSSFQPGYFSPLLGKARCPARGWRAHSLVFSRPFEREKIRNCLCGAGIPGELGEGSS